MNLINEFDLVSRADRPYILCLVNLFRSVYGRPPLGPDEDEDSAHASPPSEVSSSATEVSDVLKEAAESVWPVTPCRYHHVGPHIVLLKRLERESHSGEYSLKLRAVRVAPDEFEKLLFCRLAVHRRVCYAERIQIIEEGNFNGKGGWLP
jgi:hypothetical protein